MKRTLTSLAGLCAGLTMLASPALAGPDHKDHAREARKDASSDASGQPMQGDHAKKSLEDFVGKVELPELFIGSKAPDLQIAKFVKGDSVQNLEKGQTYVVEFWATWCGPCIAAFPHLSEEQAKYGDKVKFIGVNVWEGVEDQAERIDKVEKFVADQGERMSYTVAVENGTAMADTWMKPAAQNGIPAAFIVDDTGHIAWIGHPMNIDETLGQVASGQYDRQKAVEEFKKNNLMMAGYRKFATDLQSGKSIDEATQIADILIDDYLNDDPEGLNAIAWILLNAESPEVGMTQHKVAKRAIATANEKTGWKDWSLLDTYALAAHKLGNEDEAVKWQSKAVELVPADNIEAKAELQSRLDEYKAAQGEG